LIITLHSQSTNTHTKKAIYRECSFAVHDPIIWNGLPCDLQSTDIFLTTFRHTLNISHADM